MISTQDLKGVMAMMPAFATDDAVDIRTKSTIAVDNLVEGVDRIIRDGVNVIATTGTYGECYNLLWDEFKTLASATVEAARGRVPVIIGTTSPNPREVAQKMEFVRDIKADGVLLGVPYYWPSSVGDAVRFYQDIGGLFPDLAIVIYHNPEIHKFTFPVSAFQKLVQVPNIVGMKDSHRDTRAFMQLHRIIGGKISHFMNELQLHPFYKMGASGCWSTDVWMGPWPVLHLWDMVQRGESEEKLQALSLELSGQGGGGRQDLSLGNKRPQEYTSYVKVGPSRVPFVTFPDAVLERAKKKAAHWETLCAKYRPIVEAERAAA